MSTKNTITKSGKTWSHIYKKICGDTEHFEVFKFPVIFANNCDQNIGEICGYKKKKKHRITKKFMSKKLQSRPNYTTYK